MTKILIILFIAFAFEAVGIIFLKQGIVGIKKQYVAREGSMPQWKNVLALVGNWFANKNILLGLLLETIFFIQLQYVLGQRDVSFVWPLTAISFVMTTLAAQFILREQVNVLRWTGVIVIVIGAALISYGEHQKDEAASGNVSSQNDTGN
ncbi:MAG TPA: EamA family transporter [Desulfuromonadaceae bacterium]|nr:EamA family transporter [Desulfuromonadaceae bacterium]